ncbi:MAG TPA: hypothetical protein VFZ59_04225 [Verrucomicrobiae bacterium]|nr:hypothetical protein [Verrucomicrobiae bacterium]
MWTFLGFGGGTPPELAARTRRVTACLILALAVRAMPGMKLMFMLLLVASTAVAQSQTDKAANDSALKAALRNPQPQPARTFKTVGTNDVRIVNGKPYYILNSSNWVTLPGPNARARYARSSNYGPVFKLEKRMEARYKQGTSEGTRVWYEPVQEIAVKNYPEQGLVIDALLPSIRAMPIRTTSEGIAVYDYGTPHQAKPDKKP